MIAIPEAMGVMTSGPKYSVSPPLAMTALGRQSEILPRSVFNRPSQRTPRQRGRPDDAPEGRTGVDGGRRRGGARPFKPAFVRDTHCALSVRNASVRR